MTMNQELYQQAADLDTAEEANAFVTAHAADATDEAKDTFRAQVCSWAAIWDQQNHQRMLELFRPPWPPANP